MRRTTRLRMFLRGVTAVGAVVLTTTAPLAWDDPQGPERLLPLPEVIPEGLDFEALDALGPNWETWSSQTAELVERLYEQSFDDASQQMLLRDLDVKRQTIAASLDDPRYAAIHGPLADLYGKLSRRLEVYQALRQVLASDATPPADNAASAMAELRSALSNLQSSLVVIPQGPAWLPFIRSDELDQLVAKNALAEADRELLEDVQGRLQSVGDFTPQQQEFLRQPMFARLGTAIDRVLLSGDEPEAMQSELQQTAEEFLTALEDYESSGEREAAGRIRDSFQQIQWLAGPAAAPLVAAMQTHYFNFNLRLVAAEGFVKRISDRQDYDSGAVNENVNDVEVSGCQWTNTTVVIDFKPADDVIRFQLNLDGHVRSKTIGEVHSATVYNTGTASFRAEKEITFDGHCFYLCPARVGVNASNTTYDAETCLEWLPVARNLARNFALQQAADRKPESDAYTRNKISREVRQRFDRETREQFYEAQQKLENDLYAGLRNAEFYPESRGYSSTETEAIIRQRLMKEGQLAAGRPPRAMVPPTGLLAQVHQSMLNNGADRIGFAGQTLSQEEMNQRIEARLDMALPNRKKEPREPKEDDGTRFIFDSHDPISFQFEDGQMVMSLRAGLQRPGEEDIPAQVISVPFTLTLEGNQIVMTRGAIGVRPVERPPNIGEQIARANIMRSRIEQNIPETETRDASFTLEPEGKVIELTARTLSIDDGWLTVTLE